MYLLALLLRRDLLAGILRIEISNGPLPLNRNWRMILSGRDLRLLMLLLRRLRYDLLPSRQWSKLLCVLLKLDVSLLEIPVEFRLF